VPRASEELAEDNYYKKDVQSSKYDIRFQNCDLFFDKFFTDD